MHIEVLTVNGKPHSIMSRNFPSVNVKLNENVKEIVKLNVNENVKLNVNENVKLNVNENIEVLTVNGKIHSVINRNTR
jgi:hypothetical protein